MKSSIEIPLSKTKIVGLLIGAAIFVSLGFLFVIKPDKFMSSIMKNPDVIRGTGFAAVCFFGLCLIFIFRKLFQNTPGLIIDQYGITDCTNATSTGLIEWDDITGIESKQVMSNRFLVIYTSKPEKYLSRAKNLLSKQAMNMNYKTYGSPISIIANSLKIDFDELEHLVRVELEKIKRR